MAAFSADGGRPAALTTGEPCRGPRAPWPQGRPPVAMLTSAKPHRSVHTLLELGRAYLALDDAAGARAVVRQAAEILRERPGLGVLPEPGGRADGDAGLTGQGTVGASSLTAAEFGPRRCSRPISPSLEVEIGERLRTCPATTGQETRFDLRQAWRATPRPGYEPVHEQGLLEATELFPPKL